MSQPDLPADTPPPARSATVRLIRTEAEWESAERRDSSVTPLAAAGYVHAGQFGVENDPPLHLLVMHHPAVATYAVVCEHGTTRWVEFVRWHDDGSVLLATNGPVDANGNDGAAEADGPPGLRVIRKPDAGVSELVVLMRAEPAASEPVAVQPEEFVGRYADVLTGRVRSPSP